MEGLFLIAAVTGILVTFVYSMWLMMKIVQMCWAERRTMGFFTLLFSELQGFVVGLIPAAIFCLPVYGILRLALYINEITGGKTAEDVISEQKNTLYQTVNRLRQNMELEKIREQFVLKIDSLYQKKEIPLDEYNRYMKISRDDYSLMEYMLFNRKGARV